MTHDSRDLIRLFETCFAASYNTRLVGGAPEPIYLPADAEEPMHRILFTHDYFRSALHEIAHWCVAGAARREQVDFGYWYAPDGRSAEQQSAFEQVEGKPQALEWLFCEAAGHRCRVSLDNLSGEATDPTPFMQRGVDQVQDYLRNGIPERPACFIDALLNFYRPGTSLQAEAVTLGQL